VHFNQEMGVEGALIERNEDGNALAFECSPSGGDVIGERRCTADLPGQAEVGDLHDELVGVASAAAAFAVDVGSSQDVFRLQVAVEEAQAMHVRQTLKGETTTFAERMAL